MYYSNGQQAEETFHLQQKQLVCQHWDEAGNAMLTNGTGMYNHTDLDGVEWHGEVVDSKCSFNSLLIKVECYATRKS